MRKLTTADDVEAALRSPRTLIFKHSDRCGTSAWAHQQVQAFARTRRAPVVWLDVVRDRPRSRLVAERTGIPHESPQVLLVEKGRVTWHASHGGITEEALAAHAGRAA